MKVLIKAWPILFCVCILSCKEVPIRIDQQSGTPLLKDTTYITDQLPDNATKNVLIEDVSGVKCKNCPKAAELAHRVQEDYPGRIVVLTLHPLEQGHLTAPFNDSQDSLNTTEASDIIKFLHVGEVPFLPIGGIDRKVFGTEPSTLSPFATWENKVEMQLLESPRAVLELEIVNQVDRKVSISSKALFLTNDTGSVSLSVFISESEVITKQKSDSAGKTILVPNYEHNSVLRKGVTSVRGIALKSPEMGRVFEKGFEVEIPENYVLENCSIVALLSNTGVNGTEVLQCVEKHID